MPSDLYRYLNPYPESAEIRINGKPLAFTLDQGYAVVNRSWEKGDTLVLKLPMPVRRVICHDKVVSNRGRVALQRGPLVYCAEGADNSGSVLDLVLPDDAQLQPGYWPQLLNGVVVIEARAEHRKFNVVPYHSWLNRGQNEMTVWYARTAP